jgi:hypothetical protein
LRLPPNPPHKHHYIPEFYTRLWAGRDGKLCQMGLYPPRRVVAKRKFPAGVGFKDHLYTIPGLPPDRAAILEKVFFQRTDDRAAIAQSKLIAGDFNLSGELRVAWARFLFSTLQRNPEKVAWIARVWEVLHQEAYIEAQAESRAQGIEFKILTDEELTLNRNTSAARVLTNLIDLERAGTAIINMQWKVLELNSYARLMTSDRPVIMTNGLRSESAHVCVALGPSLLFVAAHHDGTINMIRSKGPKRLSREFNDMIVRNAHRYVYAKDDEELSFIQKRLGRQPAQFVAGVDFKKRFPPDLSRF